MFAILQKKAIYNSRYKLPAHLVTLFLLIAILSLATRRFITASDPFGILVLANGAKSIPIIVYQCVTLQAARLRKWRSLKANAILTVFDMTTWFGVSGAWFVGRGAHAGSDNTCRLAWPLVMMAVVVGKIEVYVFVISWMDWKHFKNHRRDRGMGTEEDAEVERTGSGLKERGGMEDTPVLED